MITNYSNIPVLILGYNRPFHIKKLINSLSNIKPKKVYISLDGPKKDIEDKKKSQLVKDEVDTINWKCLIKTKYSKKNLGCRNSVRKGIDWFFKYNKFGIILEDDCVPNKSFFEFCLKINNKYKNNKKIFSISGSNFYNKKIKTDYFYSKYNHCWGWASWRRAWKYNDNELLSWEKFRHSREWILLHQSKIERKFWEKIFNHVKYKNLNSWAYVWTYSMWLNKGLTIIPNKNLIKNIGFDFSATNSLKDEKKHLKSYEINFKKKLIRPDKIAPFFKNDEYVFENHFKGKSHLWPWIILKILNLLLFNPKIFFIKIIRLLN